MVSNRLELNGMAVAFTGISQTLRCEQEKGVMACEKLKILIASDHGINRIMLF